MKRPALPAATDEGLQVLELGTADAPRLQAFFDDNPAYFQAVMGGPAGPGEAEEELTGTPPEGWTWQHIVHIAWAEPDGRLAAYANLTTDLLAEHVWHLGLFIVATRHHGSGLAQRLCAELDRWAQAHGAWWLRLGVIVGNTRAERFWEQQGYTEIKRRHGLQFEMQTHSVRVMLKALGGETLPEYLARVPRDQPEAAS